MVTMMMILMIVAMAMVMVEGLGRYMVSIGILGDDAVACGKKSICGLCVLCVVREGGGGE